MIVQKALVQVVSLARIVVRTELLHQQRCLPKFHAHAPYRRVI
jgi:hypothetical protein